MRNHAFTSFFISLLLIILISYNVSASSYEKLEPEEVLDRAEVIVLGQYDFSSDAKPSDFVFIGYEFNVTEVYKGDVPKQITAGIDMYDVGWAKDFQKEGGQFLLLLEEHDLTEFLTPVVASNGMVKVKNGQIYENMKKREAYQGFVSGASNQTNPYNLVYLGVGVVACVVVFLIYRNIMNDKRGKDES